MGLQLRKVIQIVAGHRFDDGGECHGAAFGVADLLGHHGRRLGLDEFDVGRADGGEHGKGSSDIGFGIGGGPGVLIERLDHVMGFGSGLPEAHGEGDFGIGEMGEDLAWAPLAFGARAIDGGLVLGDGIVQLLRGSGDDGEGILEAEEVCVGVHRASIAKKGRSGPFGCWSK